MGFRKEFTAHRNRTIESFNLVSADISNINVNMVSMRTMLASMEERLEEYNTRIQNLSESVDKAISDINLQKSGDLILTSTIGDINKSITQINEKIRSSGGKASAKIASVERAVKSIASNNKLILKKMSFDSKSVKSLAQKLKSQAASTRKLRSALKESQEATRKVRNLINRKSKSVKRADSELESKIKSQRKRIVQLNSKLEAKKIARKPSRRRLARAAPRRIITKRITPRKTVTTIKTPKRTVTKTVTRRRASRKGKTKPKEVYEVIREKNPLI